MTAEPSPTSITSRRGRQPSPTLPTMSETQFSDKVAALAQTCGWIVAHFRPAATKDGFVTPVAYDGAGFPDLVLVHPQRKLVLFREIKMPGNKLSKAQKRWGEGLARAEANWQTWWPIDWPEIVKVLSDGKAVEQ